jgi:hypothetical protein
MSYAVSWQNGDGRLYAGRLDVGTRALRLDGASGVEELPYDGLDEVRPARAGERLAGAPTLVVAVRGRTVRVACIGSPGALGELLSRIRAIAPRARS